MWGWRGLADLPQVHWGKVRPHRRERVAEIAGSWLGACACRSCCTTSCCWEKPQPRYRSPAKHSSALLRISTCVVGGVAGVRECHCTAQIDVDADLCDGCG